MITGTENVGEQGQIPDLFHRSVRELEQVEARARHHNVLGLSCHPSAHVDVPECNSRPGFVGIQADTGLPA